MDETEKKSYARDAYWGAAVRTAWNTGHLTMDALSRAALDALHAEALEEDAKRTPGLWRLVQWQNGAIMYTGKPQPFASAKADMEFLKKWSPYWEYAIEPVREEKKPDVTVYYRVEVKMSGHWQTYRGNLTREAAEVAVGHNALYPVRAIKVTEEVVEEWRS